MHDPHPRAAPLRPGTTTTAAAEQNTGPAPAPPRNPRSVVPLRPHDVLALQRVIGNAAVQRVLAAARPGIALRHRAAGIQRYKLEEADQKAYDGALETVVEGDGSDAALVAALELLRNYYKLGTDQLYTLAVGNVVDEDDGYAITVGGSNTKPPSKSVVTVDREYLKKSLAGGDQGFADLLGTLRHEFAHVLQNNDMARMMSEFQLIETAEQYRAYQEFDAHSDEILMTYSKGPALSGPHLDHAYEQAVTQYAKMSAKQQAAHKDRFKELRSAYKLLKEMEAFMAQQGQGAGSGKGKKMEVPDGKHEK